MKRIASAIIAAALFSVSSLHAAPPRTLYKDDKMLILGGKFPTVIKLNIDAVAGESITITITEGNDDAGDQGMSWHLDDLKGKVISKGFTKEHKPVSWSVPLKTSNPVLFLEDKDTNTGKGKTKGNGFNVKVTASGTQPAPANNKDYFGGPKAWYQSGFQRGKGDRKAKKKPDFSRYSNEYDKITVDEFRRGYMDAFK